MRGGTVLVNGATGTAGRLAIDVARHLGAARVVATGSDAAKLATVGADAVVALGEDEAGLDRRFGEVFSEGVDIVIDYLSGASAERLIRAAARTQPDDRALRFVQIGNMAGREATIPAAALRAKPIALISSGLGSASVDRLVVCGATALEAAAAGGFAVKATRAVPQAEVERAWSEPDAGRRTEFLTSPA